MYSNKESVNILTTLLVREKITKVIVCPGSRDSPIVYNLCACPEIEYYPITDEHSAGFVALRMTLADNESVAVCVTSGSTLLNLAPAVAGMFYQERPLITISADRPAQWIDQQDGRTLQQHRALEPNVHKNMTLPESHNEGERWYCNRLVNEALNAVRMSDSSPMHINVPISEPLSEYNVPQLSDKRNIFLMCTAANEVCVYEMTADFFRGKKLMVVLGQLTPEVVGNSPEAIEALREVVVVLQEKLVDDDTGPAQPIGEVLKMIGEDEPYRPGHLIYIGGTVVSKRLRQFLCKCKCKVSIVMNGIDEFCDTFMHATDMIQGLPEDVIGIFANEAKGVKKSDFVTLWGRAFDRALAIRKTLKPRFSQMSAVKAFHEKMREKVVNGELFYENSSAVCLGNIFSDQYIYVNRGANGIEGPLSMAVGYVIAHQEKDGVYCVIGDSSFFYDQNALWSEPLPSNLSILLLNNGGGGIFRQPPGLERSPYRDSVIATQHTATAEGIYQTHGIVYLSARNEEELYKNFSKLFNSEGGPVPLEIFTNAEEDTQTLRDYYQIF